MSKNNILISGTSSGLGKFLFKKLSGHKFYRKKKISYYKNKKWDLIIHNGFYRNGDGIDELIDSINLSYQISKLNSKKTIFISSMLIHDRKNQTSYKKSKELCETFFNDNNKDYIIRLGSVVGKEMKKNTIYRILFDNKPRVTVSKHSKYSFINYNEILKLILKITKQNKIRTINFYRPDFISIEEISKFFKKIVKYGNFYFKSGKLKQSNKIDFIEILKNKTSLNILNDLVKEINKKKFRNKWK